MTSFEEIEHTADWAIRVKGRDHSALFVGAAYGMFSLLTDVGAIDPERELSIDLDAVDVETLLIDWLNELLFLSEEHEIAFVDFQIDELRAAGRAQLRARVRGGRPQALSKTIKAATFSGLSIRETSNGLMVELVFDV